MSQPASPQLPDEPDVTAPPVLALAGVVRGYVTAAGTLTVLNGIDLTVKSGELVALVAPSGVGKSTLLHVAGLLEKPDAGEVRINGRVASRLNDLARTALRRRDIGFVYQFHHLLPEFTALENIVMPQMIAGLGKDEAEARARQLLGYMRIEARADHRPAELSGGEQQRVAIARAVPRIRSVGADRHAQYRACRPHGSGHYAQGRQGRSGPNRLTQNQRPIKMLDSRQ
jgi:lipoprotein-releasing system ATP-binding protein